ncbi:MAG: TonB-dependent receptor [Bryobacteraceae bacterium]|nr:TonB-dependent receptor [Bryobacteraceae bacterium]
MNTILRVLLGALLVSGLFAQTAANKGQIVGTVFDQNQAVIPNAKVTIKSVATGAVRELTTGGEGRFQALLLDPGTYEVRVNAPGFAEAVFTGVIVNVGSSVDLPVSVAVGATSQSVEVGAQLVNVDLPAPQQITSEMQIRDLPINGRRFQDFATLSPTVQLDTERQAISFQGQRGINSNIMIDGTDYNNPFFGGIRGGERSNFVFTVPQSAIQEFQVVVGGYAAEYGRSTGGVLNAITKSGTNEYHGDAFYQVRHKEMGRPTPFGVQQLETLQQFGGSFGGPIIRDKLFFFAAVEHQRVRLPRNVRFAILDSVVRNDNNREAYDFFRSQEGPLATSNDGTAVTGRADYLFRGGSRLALRYNWSDASANNAVSTGGALPTFLNEAASNQGNELNGTNTGVAQWTAILSPRLVNDLRVSITRETRPRTANSEIPTFSAGPIGSFGARSFLPTTQNDTRYQFNNGLAFTAGNHTLKFGGDYNYLDTFQRFGFSQFGQFSFTVSNVDQILESLSVGGPTANRLDNPGIIQYQRQIGNLEAGFDQHQVAFYAQDAWKATRKLTLNLGLRWEGQYNFTPDVSNTSLVSRLTGFTFPNGKQFDPSRIPDMTNQWMPRFGFTYTPWANSSRLVLRGHAGIFYAATPMLLFADHSNNFRLPPGNVTLFVQPTGAGRSIYQDMLSIGIDLNRTPLGALPVLTVDQATRLASIGGGAPDPFRGASVTGLANDFRNPRSVQAGFGADWEVVRNWVVGGQFNYVNTVNLQRNVDYNTPLPQILANDLSRRPNFSAPRPLPTLAFVRLRESSARSLYRAGTFSTSYRGKKMQFQANYTLGWNFSDDDNERTATSLFYQNAYDLRQEYSFARLDTRHNFASNVVYQLPWGFSVSAIYRYQSGRPFDASTGADSNGDRNIFRPSAAVPQTSDRPFSAPGVSFARNSFRNRDFQTFDFRLLKDFAFGERVRLQFSAEAFNLFDFDNVVYDGPNLLYGVGVSPANGQTVAANANFMRLRLPDGRYDPVNTQLGFPLQAQFGLRLFF